MVLESGKQGPEELGAEVHSLLPKKGSAVLQQRELLLGMQEATSSAWTVPLNPPQSLFGWCRDAWEKLTLRAGWVWASLPVALGEGSSSDPIFLPLSWLGGSGRG